MRHKTLSCHPRNYQLDSLTLLKGVHPPIFLPYLMGRKNNRNPKIYTYFWDYNPKKHSKFWD